VLSGGWWRDDGLRSGLGSGDGVEGVSPLAEKDRPFPDGGGRILDCPSDFEAPVNSTHDTCESLDQEKSVK